MLTFSPKPHNPHGVDLKKRHAAITMGLTIPKRFYSLDVLRGVAALGIVFWHWQHFFQPLNIQGELLSVDSQPLPEIFLIFYKHGFKAVQLFFCLSGFIFFWLYSEPIANKKITFKTFGFLRMSRLYPLHFVTLTVVAINQFFYMGMTGTYFVYQINDAYHYLLNISFASRWGFESGHSFNAPIWSVSIEVLMYGLFFFFCRIFYKNMIAMLAVIIIGNTIIHGYHSNLASGITYFFLGGAAFLVYERIVNTKDLWQIASRLPFLIAIFWLGLIVAVNNSVEIIDFHWRLQDAILYFNLYGLFPLTVLSLALFETKRGTLGKRVSSLGDISYSMYLIHFPLQLMVATIAVKFAINQAVFYSPYVMALFFCVLIALSLAGYHYFELPMQRYLRSKFDSKVST